MIDKIRALLGLPPRTKAEPKVLPATAVKVPMPRASQPMRTPVKVPMNRHGPATSSQGRRSTDTHGSPDFDLGPIVTSQAFSDYPSGDTNTSSDSSSCDSGSSDSGSSDGGGCGGGD